MTPLGSIASTPPGVVSSAAGSVSTGAAERSGKIDSAGHSLAAGQRDLSPHPLDRDASASSDRDADGWTGGSAGEESRETPAEAGAEPAVPGVRPRLPDDPCGGRLDVTA